MYQIHTTPGFIIDSRPYGEADKILSIFTRELGLVTATARGIRLERSKLRYHAQDMSFGTFSLVRGKEFWRLTSVREERRDERLDIREERTEIRDERELVARLAFLLKRLLHGEEANSRLFDAIASAADFLDGHGSTGEQLKTLESVTVLRMLDALGYIGSGSSIDEQMRSGPITTELLESLGPKRLAMNRQINQALKESHL